MDIGKFADLMPTIKGFPRPEWNLINNELNGIEGTKAEAEAFWNEICRVWLGKLAEATGGSYTISETGNFLILSNLNRRDEHLMLGSVERVRRAIVKNLGGIAFDDGFGKNVLLLFSEPETHSEYMSYFYSEDDQVSLNHGKCLTQDCGQIAIPHFSFHETEQTLAHELTVCMLKNLPLPLWLSGGLAGTIESAVVGGSSLQMDPRKMAEHEKFWNSETIQEFWSGEVFHRIDSGHTLCFDLAKYCVNALAQDASEFAAFVNLATFEDGGEAAALQIYEGSLGGLPFQFFGEGDWCPNPDVWWPDEPATDGLE